LQFLFLLLIFDMATDDGSTSNIFNFDLNDMDSDFEADFEVDDSFFHEVPETPFRL